MNSTQAIGIVGSIVLFVGAFAPLISVPILGSMNYFQNGRGDGTVIALLAIVSFVAAVVKKFRTLWYAGASSLLLLTYTFITFQSRYAQIEAEMDRELAGNPFRGLADLVVGSIQLQWGWAVLVAGAGLVLVAAALGEKQPKKEPITTNITHIVVVGLACLVVGYFAGREHVKYELLSPVRSLLGDETGTTGLLSSGTRGPEDAKSPEVLAYAELLEIYAVRASRSSGLTNRGDPYVRAKIRNKGERTVRKIDIRYYFADYENNIIFETTDTEYFGGTSFLSGAEESPLKPNYVSELFFPCEKCPSECLAKPKKMEIVDIEFAD